MYAQSDNPFRGSGVRSRLREHGQRKPWQARYSLQILLDWLPEDIPCRYVMLRTHHRLHQFGLVGEFQHQVATKRFDS